MQESGKNLWQLKKSYEIAYAAFRIAAKMGEQEFAGYLKSAAISLLGAAAGDDNAGVKKKLATLEYLIRFGMDVNIMGIANGELMLREIAGLDVAMAEVVVFAGKDPADNGVGKAKNDEADIAGIFSEVDSVEGFGVRQEIGVRQNIAPDIPAKEDSGNGSESGNNHESGNGEANGILKSTIRQSAILERIRQVGNCRIKDIQEILPDSSERTIRYDLQTMVEQNLVERVGPGGPAVYYRVRQGNG